MLLYSSGTTGLPKGVLLSHRNMVASLCQTRAVHRVGPRDVVLTALPLYHPYALQVTLSLGLAAGATVVTMPRFDLEGFCRLVQDHRVTRVEVVPPIVLALAIALWLFMEYTPTGRRLYATGFNPDAARLANIKVNKLRFCSLLTSAALAGFAGVMLASSLSSGDPTAGTSYLLPAFAALFVGATVFKAGRFNAWGTIVAVLMLGTGIVGLGLVAAPLWADDMFTGVVLIAALSANVFQSRTLWMGNLRRARWMPGQLRRAEGREPAA